MSNIVGTFSTEKDIYDSFNKTSRYNLKDIFSDYWFDFLDFASSKNIKIRSIVHKEVDRMMKCKSPHLGYNFFKCNNCNHEHFQYNTCKSRFCPSCGVKYAKERTHSILSKLISCPHRHLTFTIPDVLWPLFREKRSRLNLLFEAVNTTLSSWFTSQYKSENYRPGFVCTVHTFGRDNKWNVHIHCLMAEMVMGNNQLYKKVDFFPFDMLRKRFQTILLKLLEKDIGKKEFTLLRNEIYLNYQDGFYVRAKKNEFPSSKKALEYVLRYCGRPCFASYRILNIDDNDYITFWYQRSDDKLFVVEKIHVFKFILRIIVHIYEKNFKTIRYYGFYASRKHKNFGLFKFLVDREKLSFFASLLKWRFLMLISFNKDPLLCPICGTAMEFQYVFV